MNGIIVIDKPKDFTSFDVVAVMRRLANERKIGHTGTLDPMATGVLPLLLGNAAKAQSLLPENDKAYKAHFQFGFTTDTLDITGSVTDKYHVNVKSAKEVMDAMEAFKGDIKQLPPMYSAVHKDGKRLYDLARKGVVVEREARDVKISRLELLGYDAEAHHGEIYVQCSKGTYIRSLIDDIGQSLGCGATLTALHRTSACGFNIKDCITLDEAKELSAAGTLSEKLLPVERLFENYPVAQVSQAQSIRFRNGGGLALERLTIKEAPQDGQVYRVRFEDVFIGLGIINIEKEELSIYKLFLTL